MIPQGGEDRGQFRSAGGLSAWAEAARMGAVRRWADIRRYIDFSAADEETLRGLAPLVQPHFGALVDAFYVRILEHEGARRVFTEGLAQVERLKGSLRDWLLGCFRGPWDEAYFLLRARIGRIHVRIGLEPRYMVLAMHLLRTGLERAVAGGLREATEERRGAALGAVARICDVELAVMLETYGDEHAAQMQRRERLAVIGQLGASISHEVKNPLGVIASSVYALKRGAQGLDERTQRHVEKIERNVEQANRIVTTLLDFLRARAPDREERDWSGVVAGAVEEASLPPGVRVEVVAAPDVGSAAVDPAQLARVIANLVQNAGEAMPGGGVVTVETRGDAEAVEVTVLDRGPGLATEALPHLFEPLYTTKELGTGLGLALTKAIVEAHGGTVVAGSREGGGAVFRVRLPRAAIASLEAARPPSPMPGPVAEGRAP